MKKTLTALIAALAMTGSFVVDTPVAKADGGRIAAGVAGGLIGGALLGGAIASSRPGYGYGPAPVYGYGAPPPAYVVEEPPCRMVRERFWDGYGWRMRRVEVCD